MERFRPMFKKVYLNNWDWVKFKGFVIMVRFNKNNYGVVKYRENDTLIHMGNKMKMSRKEAEKLFNEKKED